MKVTYPHMGNLFLVANAFLRGLGCEIVQAPFSTIRTLSIGTQYAPESACLPLKINLGNYIEAYKQGADTLVMVGGVGPCRIGYYSQVQKQILEDLGLKFDMIVLEPPDAHFKEVWQKIMTLKQNSWLSVIKGLVLGWQKIYYADELEKLLSYLMPRTKNTLQLEKIYTETIGELERAEDYKRIKIIASNAIKKMKQLPQRHVSPIRIGLVGEVFTVLEPFSNLYIEKKLGKMGVEVTRSIYLSQWINEHLLGGLLNLKRLANYSELAKPFLNHFVGGHGRETVGGVVDFAKQGFDGVIQIGPLTCMPEIVAQSILPSVSEAYGIPVMTIYLDEQSGEAGLVTRLEAFVDMIRYKKESNKSKENFKWNTI
ncbi:MAG: CoA protein activase [Zhaonellaceae bacterium]|jgi:predicted nucleotide-binding protein (sugar kinase/HSP70/actin superfamily)